MDKLYRSYSSFHVNTVRYIDSWKISVGCLNQNGAVPHLEIEMMMDVYHIVLASTSSNYHVF